MLLIFHGACTCFSELIRRGLSYISEDWSVDASNIGFLIETETNLKQNECFFNGMELDVLLIQQAQFYRH